MWRIVDDGRNINLNFKDKARKPKFRIIDDGNTTNLTQQTPKNNGWKIISDGNTTSFTKGAPRNNGWKIVNDDRNVNLNFSKPNIDEAVAIKQDSPQPKTDNKLVSGEWKIVASSKKINQQDEAKKEQKARLEKFAESIQDKQGKNKDLINAIRPNQNIKDTTQTNPNVEITNENKEPYKARDVLSDITHGVDRGYMKLGAGINKALAKGADFIGADGVSDWFNENYWRNQALINKDNQVIKNQYVGLGGEILSDPTVLLPLGIVGKTRGVKNTLKSMGAGALVATPTGAIKDYGDNKVSNEQMLSNAAINALAGGAINGVLASKTGNVLINNLANMYRKQRGLEPVAYSNIRRGVEIPQTENKTTSEIFGNIRNIYDDIGIKPRASNNSNVVPYDETFANHQRQNAEFIKGDGFNVYNTNSQPKTDYNVKTQIDDWVKELAEINNNELSANLYILHKKHPELFDSPADVYRAMIEIKNNPTHFFKNNRPDMSLITKRLRDNSLGKMAVVKDSGKIGHILKSTRYKKEMDRLRLSNQKQLEVGSPYPTLPRTDINQAGLTAGANAHSQTVNNNILPNQSLNFNITNDRINPTITQQNTPTQPLLENNQRVYNPSWYDEFIGNKPDEISVDYLRKYYDVDSFLTDRENILAKDIRYGRSVVEPSRIVDNGGNGGWKYERTRPIYEKNYNAEFRTTKKDVADIRAGKATPEQIAKLADDLEASTHLGYGFDNNAIKVTKWIDDLEKQGARKDFVDDLRQKAINEPHLFTDETINQTNAFIKENPRVALSDEGYADFVNTKLNTGRYETSPDDFRRGFVTQQLAMEIVRAGVGAGVGGAIAPEDERLAGAVAGAMLFSGVPHTGDIVHGGTLLFKKAKHLVTEPKAIDKFKAHNGNNGSGLIEVANKFLANEAGRTWADISNNGFLGNLKGAIKRNLTNTLDSGFEAMRDETMGQFSKISNQYSRLGVVLNQLSKEDNLAFYKFLVDEGSLDDLSPSIRAFANDVKQQISDEFSYQVKQGLIKQNTADEFSGNFLSRQYENIGLKDKFKDFLGGSKLTLDPLHKRGKTEVVSPNDFINMVKNGNIATKGDKGFSKGGKYLIDDDISVDEALELAQQGQKIKVRRDYTILEREAMGEVTDVAKILPQTLFKMASRRITDEYLTKAVNFSGVTPPPNILKKIEQLAKDGNYDEIKALGYDKVPNDPAYGAIKGKFIRRDVLYDIKTKVGGDFFSKEFARQYVKALDAWKISKTAFNTSAHFNNFVGNAFLLKLAGGSVADLKGMVTNVPIIANANKYLTIKTKAMLGTATAEEALWLKDNASKFKIYDLADEVGLFGRSQLNDMGVDSTFSLNGNNPLSKMGNAMLNAYQAEDNIARLTMFEALLKRGYEPKNAKRFTNLLMPDYTRYMPKGIRFLKNTATPFLSWTYYVMPTMYKMMLTRTGMNNVASTFSLMMAGSYLMTGINPFGDKNTDENRGKYMNIHRDGDKVTRVKMDRVIPYSEWILDPLNAGASLVSNPYAKLGSDAVNIIGKHRIPRDNFTDKKITYSNRPLARQVYDVSKYEIQNNLPVPQILSNIYNLAESKVMQDEKKRKTNDVYMPRSTTQELLKLLTGINTSNYSIEGVRKERLKNEEKERKRK